MIPSAGVRRVVVGPSSSLLSLWRGNMLLHRSPIMLDTSLLSEPRRCLVAPPTTDPVNQLVGEVERLVSLQGRKVSSITNEKAATAFCQQYSMLDRGQKDSFLHHLATNFSVDRTKVREVARRLVDLDSAKLNLEMQDSLTPPQNVAFAKIGQIQGGVKFLVDLRADLIVCLRSLEPSSPHHSSLRQMNQNLQHLLAHWFSVGFLQLTQVTWQSPCALLERVSDLEAVHPVKNWTDLKTRVGPYRRCFVYTHPSMPGEPVVILHVALAGEVAGSITSLVKDHRAVRGFTEERWHGFDPSLGEENPALCEAAIFYSVTSTQVGLQGIELGTHLIKGAVACLVKEFPSLSTFSTLSPIPGFRAWLLVLLTKAGRGEVEDKPLLLQSELSELQSILSTDTLDQVYEDLVKVIRSSSWVGDPQLEPLLARILPRLCARYLYCEKRRNNALNSVANFHLRNGSCLWRVNWLADPSPRGMEASCGLMVNYRYYLDRLEGNSNSYLNSHAIDADEQVTDLLG